MPPYKAVTSRAQSRKLFALEERGELAKGEAEGKTKAANWKSLPQYHRQGAEEKKEHPGVRALGRVK